MSAHRRRRHPAIPAFAVRAAGLWLIGAVCVTFVPGVERAAIAGTVASLAALLAAVHAHPSLAGAQLAAGGNVFRIVSECTTLLPTVLLGGAILAWPAPIHARAVGSLACCAVLWLFNLVRIGVLMWVLEHWPRAFDFVHVYLWQTASLAVVVGLFAGWVRITRAELAT